MRTTRSLLGTSHRSQPLQHDPNQNKKLARGKACIFFGWRVCHRGAPETWLSFALSSLNPSSIFNKRIAYKRLICRVTEHPHSFATDMRALRQQCIGSSIEQTSPGSSIEQTPHSPLPTLTPHPSPKQPPPPHPPPPQTPRNR